MSWHNRASGRELRPRAFSESFVGALRYVRYSRGIQVVLIRALLFSLLISVIPALLPAVGLKALHLNSSHLGILFTSMAIGSLLGAVFVVPWARAHFTSNEVTMSSKPALGGGLYLNGSHSPP